MIVAEPCTLVFFSAIPAVSVRHVSRPYETLLSQHKMCLLGSSSMQYSIVGLQLCTKNERHLVVWGISEACVAILKPNWNGMEEKIDLIFDLDQQDGQGDFVVRCKWIPSVTI